MSVRGGLLRKQIDVGAHPSFPWMVSVRPDTVRSRRDYPRWQRREGLLARGSTWDWYDKQSRREAVLGALELFCSVALIARLDEPGNFPTRFRPGELGGPSRPRSSRGIERAEAPCINISVGGRCSRATILTIRLKIRPLRTCARTLHPQTSVKARASNWRTSASVRAGCGVGSTGGISAHSLESPPFGLRRTFALGLMP